MKKISSILLILTGVFCLSILFIHAIKFDTIAMKEINLYFPNCTNNNIGGKNFFAYFTFLSNIFVDLYIILLGLSNLGIKKLKPLTYNPYIQGSITVYIVITGIVYCTILWPNLDFYPWDGPMAYANIVNIWNHTVVPLFMLILWFFPLTKEPLKRKFIPLTLIFPITYLIFSIIRGHYIKPNWYPYPFCNPKYLWSSIIKNIPFHHVWGYVLFFSFLVLLAVLFMSISTLLIHIRNKTIKNKETI